MDVSIPSVNPALRIKGKRLSIQPSKMKPSFISIREKYFCTFDILSKIDPPEFESRYSCRKVRFLVSASIVLLTEISLIFKRIGFLKFHIKITWYCKVLFIGLTKPFDFQARLKFFFAGKFPFDMKNNWSDDAILFEYHRLQFRFENIFCFQIQVCLSEFFDWFSKRKFWPMTGRVWRIENPP